MKKRAPSIHHEIGNDITSIQASVFALHRLVTEDTKKAREYLEKINTRLQELLERTNSLKEDPNPNKE